MPKQKTLNGSFTLQGKGLHTGVDIQLTFFPAPENYGCIIKRIDLEGHPTIPALAEYVTQTTRGTVLANGDAHGKFGFSVRHSFLSGSATRPVHSSINRFL